jgi:hypothetical protein
MRSSSYIDLHVQADDRSANARAGKRASDMGN